MADKMLGTWEKKKSGFRHDYVAYPIVVNETLDSLARPRQGEQKKVWCNESVGY
jgi:hypothetical protein